MWKRIVQLYDKAFDFEYSDEDDDYSDHANSNSKHHIEFSSISTVQPERHQVLTLPCEFCNAPWNHNLLLSHEISCPRNPKNLLQPCATYPRSGPHITMLPTSHPAGSNPITPARISLNSSVSTSLNSLRCPITQEIFVDPVLAEDSYTYERSNIERWIREHNTSPMTREPLTIVGLRPNRAIRDAVEQFRRRNDGLHQRSSTRSTPVSFKYELNVDVQKTTEFPFAQTFGKSLFHAKWLRGQNQSETLVLLHITGDRAMKEAHINVQLPRHSHIVRTYGLVKHNGEGVLLLQECARQGNLSELLRAECYPPTPEVIHTIILQIIDALIFLTQQGVVHGDLACRNVLVFEYNPTDSSQNLVKLTDFGISRRSSTVTSLDIMAILSAAPEVLRSRTYSEKSDVWALAILAWEIYSKGSTPMIRQASRDFSENERRILAGERLLRPSTCPETRWAIFLDCMKHDPGQRPPFIELKEKLLRS